MTPIPLSCETAPLVARVTAKKYKCRRCGYVTTQSTNHCGPTHSFGHYNCCPNCPPYAKYPEFGGTTFWDFVEVVKS